MAETLSPAFPPRRIVAILLAIAVPAVAAWLFWRTTPPVGGYLRSGAAAPAPANQPLPVSVSLDPREIYAQNCASCHGADLSGGQGSALVRPNWPYHEHSAGLVRVISEGKGLVMPPFRGRLSQQQIEALTTWLQSMNAPPGAR